MIFFLRYCATVVFQSVLAGNWHFYASDEKFVFVRTAVCKSEAVYGYTISIMHFKLWSMPWLFSNFCVLCLYPSSIMID